MSDDDVPSAAPAVIPVALGALASVVDPTGATGVGVALIAHYVSNATSDAAWRRANLADAHEVLTEGGTTEKGRTRAREPFDAENEFERQRLVLQWLQDDLAAVLGRVENLEVVAVGIVQRGESLLRRQSDPKMRPYLLNIWRNSVARPDYFSGTWMRRCIGVIETLGADHLSLLCRLAESTSWSENGRCMVFASHHAYEATVNASEDDAAARDDLKAAKLLGEPDSYALQGEFVIYPPAVVYRIVELVSHPSPNLGSRRRR